MQLIRNIRITWSQRTLPTQAGRQRSPLTQIPHDPLHRSRRSKTGIKNMETFRSVRKLKSTGKSFCWNELTFPCRWRRTQSRRWKRRRRSSTAGSSPCWSVGRATGTPLFRRTSCGRDVAHSMDFANFGLSFHHFYFRLIIILINIQNLAEYWCSAGH